MIAFSFNLSNPWSRRWEHVWCGAYNTPFKNKFIELEIIKDASLASCSFKVTTQTDHSGLYMDLGLLGYSFSFNFYDNRHWNKKARRYYIYDSAGNAS